MNRHDIIVSTLVRLGFRAALKGFDQFVMCAELFLDDRSRTVDSIYRAVGRAFCCTKSAVEKNLRRLFSSSDAAAALGAFFGADFTDAGNKELLALFCNYFTLSHTFPASKNAAQGGAAYV